MEVDNRAGGVFASANSRSKCSLRQIIIASIRLSHHMAISFCNCPSLQLGRASAEVQGQGMLKIIGGIFLFLHFKKYRHLKNVFVYLRVRPSSK